MLIQTLTEEGLAMGLNHLLLAANETAVMVEYINLNRDNILGQAILATALGLYLLALLVLSLFASKQIENEEDFLVAGRRLGLLFCWGSLIATWFGADTMTGSSTAARDEGMRGTILDPWACSFALIIAGVFYAPRLWRMKLLTTGDFFRRVYGPHSELVCCAVQIPSYFGWIAGQYLSLAAVQQAYFGIDENRGILIAFAIALVYTMVGGMWSVTLTDTVQILIAFAGILVLAAASFSAFGNPPLDGAGSSITLANISSGISRFFSTIPADDLSLLPPADATLAYMLAYTGTWATGLLGNLPGQDLQQRIFSAKDARTARAACLWSGIFYLIFGLIPVTLGLMSRLELPPGETVVKIKVLMYMAGRNMNVYLAVIFVVSFVSIVMSTACSAVLAPATILGHNFLGRVKSLQKYKLTRDRVCVLLTSLGGLALACSGESIFGLLDLSLSIALVGLFVPLTMGLYGKPRGELAAILATLFGVTFYAGRHLPEKVLLPLPQTLSARSTVQEHFDELKQAMTPTEKALSEIVRAKINLAKQAARADMQSGLLNYVSPADARRLTDENFEAGFDWLTYIELRYSTDKIGHVAHTVLIALLTVSADLYGLSASLLGYYLGQSILKRRGQQWQPGRLEPPQPDPANP
jgi:SSS family solute:Na+ symporter